jgi:hypothetical protein
LASAGGGSWSFHPLGSSQTGLLVWTLAYDPLSRILYAGIEIDCLEACGVLVRDVRNRMTAAPTVGPVTRYRRFW